MNVEITTKEAKVIIEAFNVWAGQGIPQHIWAIAESIHKKIKKENENESWTK